MESNGGLNLGSRLTPCSLGLADLFEKLIDLLSRNLEGFFYLLLNHLGLDNRRVLVVLGSAVDVADDVQLVVVAKLLTSEGRLRQLHTMEGTALAVRHIHRRGSAFGLEGDGDLISQLFAGHMPELSQERRGSPAVKATAIHVGRAISCGHTDEQLLDRVKAVVLLGLDRHVNKPATQAVEAPHP